MQPISMPENCTNKTAYKSWELEAYADGEDLPHVASHLAECPACAQEIQQLATIGAQIGSKLYRFDCPAPDDIREYYWQELSTTETAKIKAHLALCLHCTGELDRISTFMQADATQTDALSQKTTLTQSADSTMQNTVVQKLREQIQDLVDQVDIAVATLVTPRTPQMAGVTLRGESKEPSMLLFETTDTDISITLQQDNAEKWTMTGQVLLDTTIVNGKFKLVAESQFPSASDTMHPIDETGNFAATELSQGSYQLIFHINDSAIVIPNLMIE